MQMPAFGIQFIARLETEKSYLKNKNKQKNIVEKIILIF